MVLAATDPAQPYGAALAWPEPSGGGRPAPGSAGAYVVVVQGQLVAWLDRRGHHFVTFPATAEAGDGWVEAIAHVVKDGRVRSLEVRKIDGGPAGESPLAARLRAAGFVDGYRGLVMRP